MNWVPLVSQPATLEVKKSRFLSITEALRDLDEVDAILHNAETRWPNANHYAYAYRLPSGMDRAHDDGEPHGTAGLPILNLLIRRDLCYVMVVVARYFGGTKLGHGGLVHAYQKSAQLALDQTEWGQLVETLDIDIIMRYPDYEAIRHILDPHVSHFTTTFAKEITATFRVSVRAWPPLASNIRDATKGTAQIRSSTPGWDVVRIPE